MFEKCVLTTLELNWNQRLRHKKTKLNICHHMLTSSPQLQNRSFHVVERTRTPGGESYMKQTGMLVVSLRGVNFGFWSRLGCSGQSANILSRQGLVWSSAKKHRITRRETEVKFSFFLFFFFFKRSLLGVKICSCHTQMVSFRG